MKNIKKLSIIPLIILFVFLLAGCSELIPVDPTDNQGGVAPVYQGMILSDTIQELSSESHNISKLSNASNDDNEDIAYDHIKEIIASEMPFENTSDINHFADVNQDVYITVKLLNPDGQAILRFTLNGVIYQSFQFHEGSDSENLILKVNSGNASGIQEFTIDEIKYVENVTNEIKDAIFDGDRTIKLGVLHHTLPTATLINPLIDITAFLVGVDISDTFGLVEDSGNQLKGFIISNDEVIKTVDITLGLSDLSYVQLTPDTEYVFVIATVIDMLDGNGKSIHLLAEPQTFKTGTLLSIESVLPTEDSITFDVAITDNNNIGSITAIELYQGETLIESLTDFNAKSFSMLFSDTLYQIKVTYTYDLNDGNGEKDFIVTHEVKTFSKAVPIVSFGNVVASQTSVTFEINLTDQFNICTIISIDLYQGDILIESLNDLSIREFTSLDSNAEYMMRVTYTYDLNDGTGLITSYISSSLITDALQIEISSISILNEGIIEEGDTLLLLFQFVNPSNVVINQITINTINYMFTNTNVTTSGVVSITLVDITGLFKVNVEDVYYRNSEKIQHIESSIDIPVYGEMVATSITAENDYGYVISSINQFYINFKNEILYNIESVTLFIGMDELIVNDFVVAGHTITVNLPGDLYHTEGSFYVGLKQLIYAIPGEDTITIDYDFYTIGLSTIRLFTLEKQFISTPQELNSMVSGYIYELSNDIDLTGYLWSPIASFQGVLLGNHYTIKNWISIKNTSSDMIYGMFEYMKGTISDISFDNIQFYITANNVIGSILGRINGHVHDVDVQNVVVNINAQGSVEFGGLLNTWILPTYIINVTIQNVTISVNSKSTTQVSGVISADNAFIDRIYANQIDVTVFNDSNTITTVGGILASGEVFENLQISNVYAENINVDVTSSEIYYAAWVGGIAGLRGNNAEGMNRKIYVENAYARNIHITGSSRFYAPGFIVGSAGNLDVRNSIVVDSTIDIITDTYHTQFNSGDEALMTVGSGNDGKIRINLFHHDITHIFNNTTLPVGVEFERSLSTIYSEAFIYQLLGWDSEIWILLDQSLSINID